MLLDYHPSLFEEPERAAPPWVPRRRVREPQPVRPEREPEQRPELERAVIRASMNCQLPPLRAEMAATASVLPPTPVTMFDLDAMDSGISEDELLLLVAQALLADGEFDDDD